MVLGWVMYWLRSKNLQPSGKVTGAFFMVYGIIRIGLEFFREPDLGDPLLAGLSRGQWFSAGLVMIGGMIFWWRGVAGAVRRKAI